MKNRNIYEDRHFLFIYFQFDTAIGLVHGVIYTTRYTRVQAALIHYRTH